jgi:RHS repeat-associated protein
MNTLKIQFNKTLKGLLALLIITVMVTQSGLAQTVTYYHNDALGSPVAASNESGNLLWREAYRPYGSRLRGEAGSTNNVWYTGKQEDGGTGLSYFGARWYDPQLGRFTGIDPVDFKEGNIHSFNRYAYANNNPYKYIDPDGRDPRGFDQMIIDTSGYHPQSIEFMSSAMNSLPSEQHDEVLRQMNGGALLDQQRKDLVEGSLDIISDAADIGIIVQPELAPILGLIGFSADLMSFYVSGDINKLAAEPVGQGTTFILDKKLHIPKNQAERVGAAVGLAVDKSISE